MIYYEISKRFSFCSNYHLRILSIVCFASFLITNRNSNRSANGYVDSGHVRTGGEVFDKILKTVDVYLEELRKTTREGEPALDPSPSKVKQNRLTFEVAPTVFSHKCSS